MGCVKGIPSDQIQDTIRRNGLTGGNRKGVESTLEIVLEDKGSRIAFTVAKELCERERERERACNFSIPIGQATWERSYVSAADDGCE